MSRSLLSLACHLYAAAAMVYFGYLFRQSPRLAVGGRLLMALGLVAQGVALPLIWAGNDGIPVGLGLGFSLFAALLVALALGLDLAYRRPVIGAFVAPLAVAAILPVFALGKAQLPLAEAVRQPLLPVHVSIGMLGMASFAVAAGVALMYVLLERQVKAKRFGLLFDRLPPLQLLDDLNRRLVMVGFVALSVTLATGALFAQRLSETRWALDYREIATGVAWLGFAGLLQARLFAGWRGRRFAVLTLAGFALLLVSFLSSYGPVRLGALR
jgi:ABC-type uncharacterized transport system permease subunit